MKRDVVYIVYHRDTLLIKEVFKWMGKDVIKLLRSDESLKWLNTTHPKHKDLLNKINEANNTNYQ